MPELPEVETMCRGIARLRGETILSASFPTRRRLRPIGCRPAAGVVARSLRGRRLIAVHRRGKRAILQLSPARRPPTGATGQEGFLVIEPRMTGLLLVAEPPTTAHVRLRLRFESEAAPELLFWDRRGLGTVALVDADGLDRMCGSQRLGPDALGVDADTYRARLGRSSRPVKVALLDQKSVAGIGNIYASEILFRAGVHPKRRCRRLRGAEWARLAAATREILAEAVALGGSTLRDATYRTAENREGRYQERHRVYARAGLPCPRCGTPIRRIVQAQRSTFYCPGCQVAGRRTVAGDDSGG
jgi:formamidopyrimidine-DNA glycosylase